MPAEPGNSARNVCMEPVRNALTIDVEDWYHDESRGSGPATEAEIRVHGPRVEKNLHRMLEILEEGGVRATLFCLASLADKHPQLLREAHARGHEIASHGSRHVPLGGRAPSEVCADLRHSREVLEDLVGSPVEGFRAPFFLRETTELWALDCIAEAGFVWDSSWLPLRYQPARAEYITPEGRPGRLASGLWEFPLPLSQLPTGHTLPLAGGGFTLRALPFAVTAHYLARYNRDEGPAVVYTHPWEIDPDSPKLPGTPGYVRFFNGLGRKKMPRKLTRLCRQFVFSTIRDVHADKLGAVPRA
jgi:polysaccharide deacetylase family protein (PEP-CTERM system associated)